MAAQQPGAERPVTQPRATGLPTGPQVLLASLALGGVVAAMAAMLARLPSDSTSLGLDWKAMWHGLEGGRLQYGTGLRNPPWSLILLVPLGLLPFTTGWAILNVFNLGMLVLSVPRSGGRARFWLASLLLATSYVSLRLLADGNVEGLVIAGVLLCLLALERGNPWILAGGVLLATTKVQETWLLVAWFGIDALVRWKPDKWLRTLALVVLVVSSSMIWKGSAWLQALFGIEQRGSIMDVSLVTTLGRLGLSGVVAGGAWLFVFAASALVAALRRGKPHRAVPGMLLAASVLLAPYAAGNNLVSLLAVGVAPLLVGSPGLGILIILIEDLKYVASADWMVAHGANYAAAEFLLIWLILCARSWATSAPALPTRSEEA